MEGSRHEKAAVTVVSYLIGFVTAFILYANVSSPTQPNYVEPTMPGANVASVAVAPDAPVAEEPEVVSAPELEVTYVDGKLEVTVGDATNLLSFNPELTEENVDTADLEQGYHYGDLKYLLSTDENFIFFCERHDPESSACSGFVYDIDADRIYPVIKDGEPVAISERSVTDAIWTLFGLKIGSHYSANPKVPWVLISADSPLDLQ
jgi:hypothetical protein